MKKYNNVYRLLFFCCSLFFTGCNTATPERYFDLAVLNSNMVAGFANDGLLRQFESPSAVMVEGSDKPVPMKRSRIAADNIHFTEEALEKIKGLQETADAKDILQNSRALYEYILPVYKTEYVKLAGLYDSGASKEIIQTAARSIHDKYAAHFEELYSKLISNGKKYASKHSIKVNWAL